MDKLFKKMRKIWLAGISMLLISLTFWSGGDALADGNVSLYTPYTNISVSPGQSISYSIDVMNHAQSTENVDLSVSGQPNNWTYQLNAGGWAIHQLSILPGQKQTVNLTVNVPLQVDKGDYHLNLVAQGFDTLPLNIQVSESGTFKTDLTSAQPNMQGDSSATFTYDVTLKNQTANKQLYSLTSQAPTGWQVTFQNNSKDVTSVKVDANNSQDITVSVTPPDSVKAGTYTIPIEAATQSTSAKTELQAVVTGTYKMDLSTPSGVLSADVTAGSSKTIQLKVTNSGSADLRNIQFSASTPSDWNVSFEPTKIDDLQPGKSTEVNATIQSSSKAIAGDYEVDMSAKTDQKTADAQIRVTVNTSILWGWLGILIIALVMGGIYYLFRTYGRR